MWVEFVVKKIFGIRGSELKDYFDDLELEKVVPQLLQYMFEISKCENIHWISKSEWQNLNQKTVDDSDQGKYTSLDLQSHKPIAWNELRSNLESFSPQSRLPQLVSSHNKVNMVVPIRCRCTKSNEPLAYLFFTGISSKRPDLILNRVSRDLGYMERHLNFSLKYWEAQKLSLLDDLTGLFNQRHLSFVLENEIFRSQREQQKFSVLFMDIDFFKSVNDTRGHLVGSRLLVDIGTILKEKLRKSDYAFRYGGDEFVVVLPRTNSEQAVLVAERIRTTIENTKFSVGHEDLRLTLSIGLATFPDHARTYKDIIRMADEAMYCGKNKSRNIVFVAS